MNCSRKDWPQKGTKFTKATAITNNDPFALRKSDPHSEHLAYFAREVHNAVPIETDEAEDFAFEEFVLKILNAAIFPAY